MKRPSRLQLEATSPSPLSACAGPVLLAGLGCAVLAVLAARASQAQTCPVPDPDVSDRAISEAAYELLLARVGESRESFFVYRDGDSPSNHGFPSGLFASDPALIDEAEIDAACVDDPASPTGCSADPERLDTGRVTVLRIAFGPLQGKEYVGLNIEEPERWSVLRTGEGYDLTGAEELRFDVRSPDGAVVQFGLGGGVTEFMSIGADWEEVRVSLSELRDPDTQRSFSPDLSNAHILFSVATNAAHAPDGATVLLDDVRLHPLPEAQRERRSLPPGTESFGVVPAAMPPIPPDQAIRNLATTYESAIALQALLDRGRPADLEAARDIADALVYALRHDNAGAPLPTARDGSGALHDGYSAGDLALRNDQSPPGGGEQGQVRLAGFSVPGSLCSDDPDADHSFCLVLDGATGGNNAFAILALTQAYRTFGDAAYLEAANEIGRWIVDRLEDSSGFGGYRLGFTDEGRRELILGKSVENNADLFSAFTHLAAIARANGDLEEGDRWTAAAHAAGDFVIEMFDAERGRFNVGTVPAGTPPSCGIEPTGALSQDGAEVVNEADFLDSNTFTTLALAESPRYRNRIDWRRPLQYVLDTFARSVSAAGETFAGFSLVRAPACGRDRPEPGAEGIAWEFTGQAVVTARLVDRLYGEPRFEERALEILREIRRAQLCAPFGDGVGLVASTLEGGALLSPVDQCLNTPFQCIPERVGSAGTTFAIAADRNINFLPEPRPRLLRGTILSLMFVAAALRRAAARRACGSSGLRRVGPAARRARGPDRPTPERGKPASATG